MSTIIQRRKVQFDSLDEALAEVKRLHQNGYDRAGNWSLGQACNHLSSEINMTLGAPLKYIPKVVQRLSLGTFLRTVPLGKIGTSLGMRVPTVLPQNQPVDDNDGVDRLERAIARLREPEATHLVDFHRWHCEHHLGFLIPRVAESNASTADTTSDEQLA